jgi:hypothetical protein
MDYSDTSVSEMDFHLSLDPPLTTPYDDESLIPDRARYLDTDDVYPFTDETTAFVPEPTADSMVSGVNTEVDHDRYTETADDVSGTQFTAQETEAQKRLVETVLSALAPSLQKCMKDCVTASTQAAKAVINAQQSRDQSSVLQSDNTSAAPYLSPPPSLDNLNQNSVYDSDHEPTRFDTSFHTSAGSPPASQLSSTQLRNARMARRRAKRQLRHEKKTAAWRAKAQPPTDFRVTADSETRAAAWNTDREARRLEKLTRDAARFRNRQNHEEAWKAKNNTLSDAPLHLVTNRVTKNGQVERDTVESG